MRTRTLGRRGGWFAGLLLVGCLGDAPGLDPDGGATDGPPVDGRDALDAASTPDRGADDAVAPDGGPNPPPVQARAAFCVGAPAVAIPAESVATSDGFFDALRPMAHSPQVADLNCDGYDDLLTAVPLAGTVDILFGSPSGLMGGRTLSLDVGEPHLVRAGNFDDMPGPELVVMGTVDGRWTLTGFDLVDGVPVPLAQRGIDDLFIVRPEEVPLHIEAIQLDDDPAFEMVFGTLDHLYTWPLEWSRRGFALSPIDPPLLNPEGRNEVSVAQLYVVPRADGPDGVLGMEEDRAIYWEDDGAGYTLHSVETGAVEGPLRNLRAWAVWRVEETGFPTPIGAYLRDALDAEAVRVVPGAGREGRHLFERLTIDPMTVSEGDGVFDAIATGQFSGAPTVDVLLLDRRQDNPPSIVALLPDVEAFEDTLGPVGRVTEYRIPGGFHPVGMAVGDFDGDSAQELILYDRQTAIRCLAFDDEAGFQPCE